MELETLILENIPTEPSTITRWELQKKLPPSTSEKLAMSKLRKLVRKNLISGCACGCRGDFHKPITPP